jgi:zinc/manganese transport system substrate-binding protein
MYRWLIPSVSGFGRLEGLGRAQIRTFTAALLVGAALGFPPTGANATGMVINVVASTNVYADVITQLGGSHVKVTGILSNPNTDPHTYESSTKDAGAVAGAALVVQNGIGYDDFMGKLEGASPNTKRMVIDVGAALGYKNGDNPHLWYKPNTMPRIAPLIVAALDKQDPADKMTFQANLKSFQESLQPWFNQLSAIKKQYSGTPVAVTEPVFDYAVQAAGLKILTPYTFQAAIMGGTDPSPQDVQLQKGFFSKKAIKVFFYNQQAVAPITVQLLSLAHKNHVPVVGVYETKPLQKTYQQWMMAEMTAVQLALSKGVSTEQIH